MYLENSPMRVLRVQWLTTDADSNFDYPWDMVFNL